MKGIEVGAAAMIIVVCLLLLAGYMASEQLWMFSAWSGRPVRPDAS